MAASRGPTGQHARPSDRVNPKTVDPVSKVNSCSRYQILSLFIFVFIYYGEADDDVNHYSNINKSVSYYIYCNIILCYCAVFYS